MPEMTQNEALTKTRHRKKNRESHNEVERHRKKKINSGINRIGDLIPCSPALKQSKNMILDQAFKYITELKRQNDELLLNGGDKEQACEIRKLRKQLADIQKENARYIELLKSNDICLYDDPTLHWKGKMRNTKAPFVVAEPVQKLPLCLNGTQLSSSNHGAAVHGITFNVGQNLQKQTANVVPVQRTCGLVTPVTVSGGYPLGNKPWQANAVTVTTGGQHPPLCLPVTAQAPSTGNNPASKGEQSVSFAASSPPSSSFLAGPASQLQCSSTTTSQAEKSVTNLPGQQQELPGTSAPASTSFPSGSSLLAPEASPAPAAEISLQEAPSLVRGQSSAPPGFVETVKDAVTEILTSTAAEPVSAVPVSSREHSSAVEFPTPSAAAALTAAPLESSWSLSGSLSAAEQRNVSGLTRISSDGNTQTTWTTLQLAGNTVQPLSQTSSAVIPMLLTEQQTLSKDVLGRQATACINLNTLLASEAKPVEQVMVKMPSCQQVPVQSLISQPQAAANILPLNPPVQVIQVAQPIGPALNPAPGNQNIIFLQPPTPAPCPPVLRAEVSKPAMGQQIVIIQAPPNQTQLPVVTAQPAPSVVLPLNASSPVVCTSSTAPHPAAPQTVGGKHLVHILPRPTSVASGAVQPCPVSTTTSNQQTPTISLNGHLFALQPVTPSAGTSSQAPMQIIQPTTSEDPNTNVALNAFGALANLSQSISQMAGQSCVQFSVTPPTVSLAGASMPVNCISVAGAGVSAANTAGSQTLPLPSTPTKLLPVKPVGGTPSNVKAKKAPKKPGVKKTATKKDPVQSVKSDPSVGETQKQQPSSENPAHAGEAAGLAMPASAEHDKLDASVGHSSSAMSGETDPLMGLNHTEEAIMLGSEEQFPAVFPSADACASGEEHPARSKAAEGFNSCVPTSDPAVPSAGSLAQGSVAVLLSRDPTTLRATGSADGAVHKPCLAEEDPPSLTATHLLEVQILTDDPKDASPSSLKPDAKEAAGPELLNRKAKPKGIPSAEPISPDVLLLNTSPGHAAQPCVSEQEVAVSGSCVNNRQTDSPLSTSSGSSRNFSVASMLPDASREDAGVAAVPSFNGSAFAEQSDIVAVAASVIFDQETIAKGNARLQAEAAGRAVPRDMECEMLPGDCRHLYKSQSAKETLVQVPTAANSFNSVGCVPLPSAVRLQEKNCPAGINATNLSLQIPTSHSQTGTSLSINNLIHQSDLNHSTANGAQPADQLGLSTAANPAAAASNAYENQSSALSDYSPEQLRTLRATVMQVAQATDSLLKHDEGRKEAGKRCAHEDGLLSSAKRQKQCQPHMRQESLQPQSGLSEQSDLLVARAPTNSTSSGPSGGHGDGLSTLFPPNSFVNANLRQADMRCGSQPPVSEQGQMSVQHLQSLPQLTPNQQVSHLHSNPYLKQQQQGSLLREQHHLYQQHHAVHVDNGVRSQPHNVQQQQRLIQHEAQMQKKRGAVPGGQAARVSLQQKHQLSDQNRQKGGQQHSHHQQIQQQMAPHFGSSQVDKTCENNGHSRNHHPQNLVGQEILHQHQQEVGSRPQGPGVSSEHMPGHGPVQRLMTSRSLEQQMVSQPSIVSRPTNMTCAPHRQERNRVSSYSAEALIGKSPTNSEQRMGIAVQRLPDQHDMRKYMDVSRNKSLSVHNMQSRMSMDHPVNDGQHLPDCQTFKTGSSNQQQSGGFDAQTSRNNDVNAVPSMRGMQSQTYRISQNPNSAMDRQKHLTYQPVQDVPITNAVNESSCHQSFMQSLLTPLIGEQIGSSQRSIPGHQRSQYNPSSAIEYGCPPARDAVHLRRDNDGSSRESCDLAMGQATSRSNTLNIPFSSSSGDIQGRNTSPHSSMQKPNVMRQTDSQGSKNHLNIQVSINMHGVVHPSVPHQPVAHGNVDQRQTVRHGNPPIAQRSRHPLQEEADSKARQSERNRPGTQRHGNVFDPTLPHLPLAGPGSMIIGCQQSVNEKRAGIVRFVPDGPQVTSDNPTPDQHSLAQNFGFPFIPEGSMNPPINANPSFIPPVTQATATRTSSLIPVDPQNTLPSFYPSYSPAHPSLANDITIPYFSNQMFPNPGTEKPSGAGLNNRFGSILSPPRPVGFSQTTFPLLPDMAPMHMTNPSHLSNFNLTSLFPEIATALPAEGSAMSPLLSISHSNSESSKQSSNRPAHNISHILGHDSSSAV